MADVKIKQSFYMAVHKECDLSAPALQVFGMLLMGYHNINTDQCNPSIPTLISMTRVKRSAIYAALAELRTKGVVSTSSAGGGATSNNYEFPAMHSPQVGGKDGKEITFPLLLDPSITRTGQPVHQLDPSRPPHGRHPSTTRILPVHQVDPNKEQNTLKNKQQNTPAAPRGQAAALDRTGGWSGFFEDLEVTFRNAGYGKTPADMGRPGEWEVRGYKPAVCLSVIRGAVSRIKTIKTLSWFDKPLEKAHERIARDPEARAAEAAIEHERIYVGTPEAKAWKKHDEGRSRPFNPFMRDPANGKKYALRPTRWPPGYDPALKDAGHVTAELELIAQGRGR